MGKILQLSENQFDQIDWVAGDVPPIEELRDDRQKAAMAAFFEQVKPVSGLRADGWINSLTGMGDPSRDKRHLSNLTNDLTILQQLDAEFLWRSDDMCARIIEKVPEEMTREGYEIQLGEADKDLSEATEKYATDFDVLGKIKEALEYARAYGGAGIFLGADDGEPDLTKPLNIENVKSFDWMNVLTPLELFPRIWYGDPRAPKYGEVMIYRIQRFVFGGAVESGFSERVYEMPLVHESRIIRFDGVRVSRRQLRQRNGWGDSVLMRVLQVISDFQQSYTGAAILIQDFAPAVVKIKGLAELLASQDQASIQKRAQAIELARSIARAIIIDSEEEYERKSTTVTGLPELLDRMALRLAAAAEMPVTMLMGQAPAGLNATGASDIRWFYDRIKSQQTRKLKPALERIHELIFRSKKGPTGGKVPENWSIKFPPLWQNDGPAEADMRLKMANADVALVNAGILSPQEVAASRFGGDEYSLETQLDIESREAIEQAAPDEPLPGPVPSATRTPQPPPDDEAPKGSTTDDKGNARSKNPPNLGSTDGEAA